MYQVIKKGKIVTLPPYQTVESSIQLPKSVVSTTMGFSRVPLSGSSGNSSLRNSLLHCRRCASVIVGNVRMRIGGGRDTRGGMGNGRDWEECREEEEEESGGV